jgi:hypothetical protein
MKSVMQRFTRWHNRMHKRRGNLWEETFKSGVVEDSEEVINEEGRRKRRC